MAVEKWSVIHHHCFQKIGLIFKSVFENTLICFIEIEIFLLVIDIDFPRLLEDFKKLGVSELYEATFLLFEVK